MISPSVSQRFADARRMRRALLYVLIDPDRLHGAAFEDFVRAAGDAGVDGFLIGGSLAIRDDFAECVARAKQATALPVVIFPGGVHQICGAADAILFLSVVSGRNPEHLIGQHVVAAPLVRACRLEAVATAYMIVASDHVSTAEYMSGSKPLPREKPELAAAHAMAAELLGMQLVYLEAGSGASQTVPDAMISTVAGTVSLPVVVGGGIRTAAVAAEKVRAGASIIVVGNHFENPERVRELPEFADAVHDAQSGPAIWV